MATDPTPPRLAVYWDDACLEYRMPDGAYYLAPSELLAVDEPHPERPERLENIRWMVERTLAEHVEWRDIEPATTDQLATVHSRDYIAELEGSFGGAPGYVTADTWVDTAMLQAARLAAGAAIAAAGTAIDEPDRLPYVMMRPSGHHAQPDCADGYCLFNNVALAAEAAVSRGGIDRVAVIDWDVHHGNGTQAAFFDRADVLPISIHNDHGPWDPESHPQTGLPEESGAGDGAGCTVNIPVPGGTGDRGYERVFDRVVEPIVRAYEPDLVLVSAGQDPGVVDPQGQNVCSKAGFREMGRRVRALADHHADGRLALMQEGGYNLSHLPFATLGALEGALGVDADVTDPFAGWNEDLDCVERALDRVVAHYDRWWPTLS